MGNDFKHFLPFFFLVCKWKKCSACDDGKVIKATFYGFFFTFFQNISLSTYIYVLSLFDTWQILFLFVSVSVCPCLSFFLSVCLPVSPTLSLCLPLCLSLTLHLPVALFVSLSLCLSFCICLSLSLPPPPPPPGPLCLSSQLNLCICQ